MSSYEVARAEAERLTRETGAVYVVETILGPNGETEPEYRATRANDIPGYAGAA